MHILYLTNNPNLGSTTRILQCWLLQGPALGLQACVAAQQSGAFPRWLAAQQIAYKMNPMPWPSRRWPVPPLWHAWRLARWATRHPDRLAVSSPGTAAGPAPG